MGLTSCRFTLMYNDSGQVAHTYVPVSLSSLIRYCYAVGKITRNWSVVDGERVAGFLRRGSTCASLNLPGNWKSGN